MTLALNWFALLLAVMVSFSLIISSFSNRDTKFYLRSILFLIPVFAQIRQVLVLTGYIEYVPWFLFLVYFLLRLIGPIINWHTHLQFNKPINFFSILNLATYVLLGYTLYYMIDILLIDRNSNIETIRATFTEASFYSLSYPVLQLIHVGAALRIILKNNSKPDKLLQFMKVGIITALIVLVGLQLSYLFLSRNEVEMLVAPVIFIVVYGAIMFISLKFSSVFDEGDMVQAALVEFDQLSNRETEVLRCIAQGKTDKEIAEILHLSVYTIATYCRRIYGKLEVKNRTEAANLYNNAQNQA